MKRLFLLTAASVALWAGAAIGQPVQGSEGHPTETVEQSKNAGQVNGVPAETPRFLDEQKAKDVLASDLIGRSVMNPAREAVGEINDLIGGKDGRIKGLVIGVGGFLGIGEKNVAVQYQDVTITRNEHGEVMVLSNLTKETLSAAPAYRSLEVQSVIDEDDEVRHTY